MHWLQSAFSRTSHKTLALFLKPLRSLVIFRRLHDENDASRDQLVLQFSELVKRFSRRDHAATPQPGARPRFPHPFEYNNLMKGFAEVGETDEVLRLLREMKEFGCHPDVACYTTVVDSLVIGNRPEEAVQVFDEMVSFGLVPDAASFTVLVKMYSCYLRQFDSAYEVIRWMVNRGCDPDVVTYSTLITGLCSAGRIVEAFGVLDQMLEEKCFPNVYTYTPIVQAYCANGRIKEAMRLLGTMESIGCTPNTVSYNVLIEALCRLGSFDEVDIILAESATKGWEPDVISYSIYIDGLCKWGKADKSFELLEVMLEKGLYPTAVTLNILLDCLCRSFKAWEAKCLLERSAELEWDVDSVNCNTVMSRLCEIGMWRAVLKLFVDMFKKGISWNTFTFGIVIHSLCDAGKLHMATCMLENEEVVANVVTYTTLIHGFYVAGKMDEVHHLFWKMVVEKVMPNRITYSIMIDCLCREGNFLEAIGCFLRSLEDEFSVDLLARLVYGLVMAGKVREMVNLLDLMLGQGSVLDVRIFHALIKAFCRKGGCKSAEIYRVCCILDRMLGVR